MSRLIDLLVQGNIIQKKISGDILIVDLELMGNVKRQPYLYKGVDITPTVLKNFGFELFDEDNNGWMLPSFGEYNMDEQRFYFDTTSINVEHAHHIQNLYLFIKGEQLPILSNEWQKQ